MLIVCSFMFSDCSLQVDAVWFASCCVLSALFVTIRYAFPVVHVAVRCLLRLFVFV